MVYKIKNKKVKEKKDSYRIANEEDYDGLADGFLNYMYNHKDLDSVYDGSEGEFMGFYLGDYIHRSERKEHIKYDKEKVKEAIYKKSGQ